MEFRCCNILEAALGMVLEPSQFSRTEKREVYLRKYLVTLILQYILRVLCV
jgi:hypothetical protein